MNLTIYYQLQKNKTMKKYFFKILTALVIAGVVGCGNSQQNSNNNNKIDTIANQTATTCHDKPYLSLHQPQELSCPPFVVKAFQ